MPYKARPIADRFWEKVDRSGDCWRWTASTTRGGYGNFAVKKHVIKRAHRVAWVITYGAVPAGLWVLHRCDTPLCVRPEHLFLGTPGDNTADMVGKRRARGHPGSLAPNAILGEEDVLAIRAARAIGTPVKALAAQYGVARSTISHVTHDRWRHLPS
jgi:hypothetical protein